MSQDNLWYISIPLIWWKLNIHNKEQWDINGIGKEPLKPKICVHLEKPNYYCKRLFYIR